MAVTIRLKNNGPYIIDADHAADIVIVDAEGNPCVPEPGRAIKLCRCGGSLTKPFCDGTHRHNGFGSSSAAAAKSSGSHRSEPSAS